MTSMLRVLPLLLLVACAQRAVRPAAPVAPQPRPVAEEATEPAALEEVLAIARAHVGRRAVRVNGRTFPSDCSNFVRGVYSAADLDLMSLGHEHPGANGVALLHHFTDRYGENHTGQPAPGDLVFFDDTWDRNGNGRLDDPLTHVGIVDEVDEDGTAWVIHLSGRGVVRDPMNLARPHDRYDENGKAINAWLRAKSSRDPPNASRLMGELFAGFGRVALPAEDRSAPD